MNSASLTRSLDADAALLVEQMIERMQSGESNIEELIAAHPEHADTLRRLAPVAQVMALRRHHCEPCDAPVWLVKTTGLLRWSRLLFQGWQRLFGDRLHSAVVRGLHGSMFEPEHVQALADTLAALLIRGRAP